MTDFGVPKEGLAPGDAHIIPALKSNQQSRYSFTTFDYVNPPSIIIVRRLHHFMYKKRRPLMTRRARRKMVRR